MKTIDFRSYAVLGVLALVGFFLTVRPPALAYTAGDACSLTYTQIRGEEVIGENSWLCNGTTLDVYESVAASPLRKGIFTASPQATLDVNGEVRIGNTSIACSATNEGAIRYVAATNIYEFCNGSAWSPFEQAGAAGCAGPASCPAVGNICTDGTVFAGCVPPLHDTPFFVTRCDAGLTTTTTACDTGARATKYWSDDSSATNLRGTTVTGITDGAANTTALTNGVENGTGDSKSTAGLQIHQAAQYCADLTIHGYSDWYLPAHAEIFLMWVNSDAINNGDAISASDFIGDVFWSSSEAPNNINNARQMNFFNGNSTNISKTTPFYVRCARHD